MVPYNGQEKRTTPTKGSGSKGKQLLEIKKQYTIKHTGMGRKSEEACEWEIMAYENGQRKLKTYGKNASLARFITVKMKFLKNSQSTTKRLSASMCRKGKQADPSNYRLLSLISVPGRMREKTIWVSICLIKKEERNIMNGCQYGMM